MLTVRYTEWDGSQRLSFSAEQVFEKLAEYLSYTDDAKQALECLMRNGVEIDGVRVLGLDEFLEALRSERRHRYAQYNLDHALDELWTRLRELVGRERAGASRPGADDAPAAAERRPLEALPSRLSEAIEQLKPYEFADPQARAAFARLLEELDAIRDLEEFQRRFGELFQGTDPLGYDAACEMMRALLDLNHLEEDLLAGNLDEVDTAALGALLGSPGVQDFRALRHLMVVLTDAGYVRTRAGRLSLSAKAVRQIGQLALRDIYQSLLRDRAGTHSSDHRGLSESRPETTKPYAHGDPLDLDVVGTLRHALVRHPDTPLCLDPADFHVFDRTHATTTSTVLLLDMSWSMSWEGRFAAAKKVALAMEGLIRSRYPRDYLGVVGFYTRATELTLHELPEVSWNMGDPFTNLQDGLRLAGELLRKHPSTNQYMIVITDGQPTAYFSRGRLYCEWPLAFGGISPRAAQETLREVERVTRRGVVINTFMLDDNPSLRTFVERMTRINKGRALFTRPDRLGQYLLVDYIAQRRKRV